MKNSNKTKILKIINLPMEIKIVALVIFSVILSSFLNIITVIPTTNKIVSNVSKNYIYDITLSYGDKLNTILESISTDEINTKTLGDIVKNLVIEDVDSAYAYILDRNGDILYHPNKEANTKVENDFANNIINKLQNNQNLEKSGFSEYEYKNTIKYSSYYITNDNNYVLFVAADKSDILNPVNKLQTKTISSSIFSVIITSIIAIIIIKYMIAPLNKLTKIINDISDLDLTQKPEQFKLMYRKDEIGKINNAIMSLQEKLSKVISDLKSESNILFSAAEILDRNSSESANAVEQLEQAVHDMAESNTSQARETEKATEEVILIGNMISDTNEEYKILYSNVDNIKSSSKSANKILKELDKITKDAKVSITAIYNQTNKTNSSVLDIQKATEVIFSIAEETNLLSLNASIEAARAGEAGKGFAIVASQIQKLAEQSNKSAEQIERIIADLIKDSEQAVLTMNDVIKIMEIQGNNIKHTTNTFTVLENNINSSIDAISIVSEKTRSINEARINVIDSVQSLSAISEQNAATSEETSASTTEIGSVITDISSNANKLKEIAKSLNNNISLFKLE